MQVAGDRLQAERGRETDAKRRGFRRRVSRNVGGGRKVGVGDADKGCKGRRGVIVTARGGWRKQSDGA